MEAAGHDRCRKKETRGVKRGGEWRRLQKWGWGAFRWEPLELLEAGGREPAEEVCWYRGRGIMKKALQKVGGEGRPERRAVRRHFASWTQVTA